MTIKELKKILNNLSDNAVIEVWSFSYSNAGGELQECKWKQHQIVSIDYGPKVCEKTVSVMLNIDRNNESL